MMCVCRGMDQLPADQVQRYVEAHLTEMDRDPETWVIVYECPRTGVRWLGDFPHSQMHGGGPMRLRTFTTVSRAIWSHLFLVRQLLEDDPTAVSEASDLRLRLEVRYPGTDPTAD